MNDISFINLSNGTLVVLLESFPDYFLAMRFVLSFKLGFYGSQEHKRLLNYFTEIIKTDTHVKYVVSDKYHREDDLPAVISVNGTKCWFKNGKRHRDISHNHREKKPAIEYCFGDKEFWHNGKYIGKL